MMPRMIAPITLRPFFVDECQANLPRRLRDQTGQPSAQRRPKKRAAPGTALEKTGGDLLSQEVALQVPSALRGLTALFGMGRGVSLSLSRHRKGQRRPPWSLKTALGRQEAEQNPSSPRPISTGLLITLL